jgi:hypothetical protein
MLIHDEQIIGRTATLTPSVNLGEARDDEPAIELANNLH